MIGFKNFLTERVSDVVYHFTYLNPGMKIIHGDKFELSDSKLDADEREVAKKYGKGKIYYLSTARTRVSGFSGPGLTEGGINFTLDGRLLSRNYSGKAVDFYNDLRGAARGTNFNYPQEQEDRIFTDKKEIINLHKYLLNVEIILPDKELKYMSKSDLTDFIGALRKLSGRKVDYYVYATPEDFKNKRKKLAITRKDGSGKIEERWNAIRGL